MHMRLHLPSMFACCLVVCLASGAARADDMIGRFLNARKAQFAGMPRLVIEVTSAMNGRTVNLAVPNKDEKKAMFDPKPEVLDIVKGLKSGDFVKVSYTMQNNTAMVQTIASYPVKPGEELANAFVFVETYPKKENKIDYQMVDVKKFDQPFTFVIPNKKDASSGDMVPDADLLADANKIKAGDVVLIDATNTRPHPVLKSIETYTPPQPGHFKGSSEQEVESGQKTPVAEIEADGKTINAMVPGKLDGKKWTPDAKVLGEVKRLGKDVDVLFRVNEDNGKFWLRDIEKAPHQSHTSSKTSSEAPAAKPAADPKPSADDSKKK